MKNRKSKIANRKSVPTDWGRVAEWYDDLVGEEGSEFQREIIFPGALRMLALRAGEKVLDLACGQGAFCRLLAEKGAKPTGVDAALELIRLARERSDPSIEYVVGDARKLDFLPAGQFSAVSCILFLAGRKTRGGGGMRKRACSFGGWIGICCRGRSRSSHIRGRRRGNTH